MNRLSRIASLLALTAFWLSACGADANKSGGGEPPPANDSDLEWDQGNWDEENWQ
jgi:hypothetical protein